jgi:hypothetical protein
VNEFSRGARQTGAQNALFAVLVVLAVAAYCAPWIASTGASLSLNAYDLAEWSSLVPGVRFGDRPMTVPGLLRSQLIFATGLVALLPSRRQSLLWWAAGAAALALVVAQLPPLEYFLEPSWRIDVNYGQQATFALLALFDAALCWVLPRGEARRLAIMIFAAAGIVTGIAGVSQAVALVASYDVPAALGPGLAGYVAAMFGIVFLAGLNLPRRSSDQAKTKEGAVCAL